MTWAGERAVRKVALLTRRRAALLLAAATGLALAGCTTGPPLAKGVHAFPSEQVEIFWVRAYPRAGGVLVTGNVRRASMARTVHWGHLHVSVDVSGAHGRVSRDTRWTGSLATRVRRSARFSVLIPGVSIETVKSINVEYRGERDPPTPPEPSDGAATISMHDGKRERM